MKLWKAFLTPLMCNSYSSRAWPAISSSSGPYRAVLLAMRLFFTLVTDVDFLTSSRMNLSGMTPIFYKARACTLVLGKPSMIHDWFSFSQFIICFFTKSITMLSSTKQRIKLQ